MNHPGECNKHTSSLKHFFFAFFSLSRSRIDPYSPEVFTSYSACVRSIVFFFNSSLDFRLVAKCQLRVVSVSAREIEKEEGKEERKRAREA